MIDLEVVPKFWVIPLVGTLIALFHPIVAARRAKYPGKWPTYYASRACPGRVGPESAKKKNRKVLC